MKQAQASRKTLQFCLAKEFIEERLCLTVSFETICELAAYIDNLEKKTDKNFEKLNGGAHGHYKN